MLKPKRKITKKEIRQDPLLETINELQQKFVEYKPWIIRVGSVLVVIAALLVFMQTSRSAKRVEGETIFGRALVAYEQGDFENAQFQFEALSEEYSGFNSGKVGRYYLGVMAYDNQDFERAEEHLIKFNKSGLDAIMCKNSHIMLADIYKKTGQDKKVEKELKKAAELSSIDSDRYSVELSLVKYYIEKGEKEKAKALVSTILDDKEIPYNLKKQAEELSGGMLD